MICSTSILTFIFFTNFIQIFGVNIHRAVPSGSWTAKFPNDIKTDTLTNEEYDSEHFLENLYNTKVDPQKWVCALIASVIVGSTGILPLLIFKAENGKSLKESISPGNLKLLLSFAVGGLLGDVFLHLLPEAWMYIKNPHNDHLKIGLWVMAGLLSFMIIEKIFVEEEKVRESIENQKDIVVKSSEKLEKNEHCKKINGYTNGHIPNGHHNGTIKKRNGCVNNGIVSKELPEPEIEETVTDYSQREIKVIGYLNLLANCSDNFTHGLAVAGSFSVGIPVGICTTIAILMHEIPHEIGDFAILLKAGLNRWEAARGQIITATGAIFGCLFGLLAESAGEASSWILPFTSGGFIYIALVTLTPDLVKEDNFKESAKQIVLVFAGICSMAFVSAIQH